jgi:hypothetical protein
VLRGEWKFTSIQKIGSISTSSMSKARGRLSLGWSGQASLESPPNVMVYFSHSASSLWSSGVGPLLRVGGVSAFLERLVAALRDYFGQGR